MVRYDLLGHTVHKMSDFECLGDVDKNTMITIIMVMFMGGITLG